MKKITMLALGLLLAGCALSNGVKSPEDGMMKSFAKCALKSDSTVIMLVPSRGFLADAIASATTSVSNNDGGFYNNLTAKNTRGCGCLCHLRRKWDENGVTHVKCLYETKRA